MKRSIIAIVLAVVLVVGLTACDNGGGTDEAKVTIGFSVYDMQYEFFQEMEKGTREQVEAFGYDYILHDEKSDETEMVTGAINLIDQGIDALIISPHKPEALSSIVDAAKAKGIPVIVNDIGGGGADYDVIVISDCFGGGEMAADYTVELLGDDQGSKEVAIIKCETSAVYAIRRGAGYKSAIEAAGFTVVAEITANSKSDEGYAAMQDILVANPNIVAVFAENDPMAVGAANAIADAGRDDIIVIGFNGDGEAIEAMKDGIMHGTVAQSPYEMGKLTVNLAKKLLAGETLTFGNDAEREIYADVKMIKMSDV